MADEDQRFTTIYHDSYRLVLAYCRRRTDDTTAQEVTDETFLIAWRKLGALPPDPVPWLIVTARNVLSDAHRREQRRDALFERLSRTRSVVDSAGEGADHAALERLTVLAALAGLSDIDRTALMLTVWDGLTHRQAAKVMDCSTATFAVRHHRARHRLDDALAPETSSSSTIYDVRIRP